MTTIVTALSDTAATTTKIKTEAEKTKDEAFLADLFDAIDSDVKVTNIESFVDEANFKVVVRTKLAKSDDQKWGEIANSWAEKFSNQTGSRYAVRTTKANMERLVFRKVFRCKHKDCRSSLDVRVKKITKNTVKRDRLLREGFNGEITVCIP